MKGEMPGRLEGRVAIVTGAGHGIGKSYAEHLGAAGARVVIAEIDTAAGDDVASVLQRKGYDTIALGVDVSDSASTTAMARSVADHWGRIDILVNNAAVFSTVQITRVGFDQIDEEEWDRVLEVNLKGTWLCCRAVAPYMRKQHYGKIINISSTTAFISSKLRAHYVASKAAVAGITRTLAAELGGDGIRVNCIVPGSTLSEDDPTEEILEMRRRAAQSQVLEGILTPDAIARVVPFLGSSESDFITGQMLCVNSGAYMH